jgi:hypothetical protein
MKTVWVFVGEGRNLPSGVFETLDLAEAWIEHHGLTGLLTEYPVNKGAYEAAIESGSLKIRRPEQSGPDFVARISNPGLDHFHYENGHQG